jgi:hypothetical protein
MKVPEEVLANQRRAAESANQHPPQAQHNRMANGGVALATNIAEMGLDEDDSRDDNNNNNSFHLSLLRTPQSNRTPRLSIENVGADHNNQEDHELHEEEDGRNGEHDLAGHSDDSEAFRRFVCKQLRRMAADIRVLAQDVRHRNKEESIGAVWSFASNVVDRLCLFTYAGITIIYSCFILLWEPPVDENNHINDGWPCGLNDPNMNAKST